MSGAGGVAERLDALLRAAGERWPAPIEHLEVADSTNQRLRQRAASGAPAWTVVLADRQTQGRGRAGRGWESPPGNLYLSLLLRRTPARASLVPLAAGVALAEALQPLGVVSRLKWPNDVLVDGRKLAGILAEAASAGGVLEWIVLGIGVNITEQGLPETLRGGVATLDRCGARDLDPVALAARLLPRIRAWQERLCAGEARAILEEWRARSLPWWDRAVVVRAGDQTTTGILRQIDEHGALVLEREDGTLRTLCAGDVSELRAAAP